MNDILIIHNYLWSHYKAVVFSKLNNFCTESGISLHVIQMAESEKRRNGMGEFDLKLHNYPHSVLFRGNLDEINFWKRFKFLYKEVKANKAKVINIPGYEDWAVVAIMLFLKISGYKIVMSFDSTKLDSKRNLLKEFLKSILLRVPNSFLCYGQLQKDYLKSLGVKDENIYFRCQATNNKEISNIYDKVAINRNDNSIKKLLYVGRIDDSDKNIFKLIDIFDQINNIKWELVIVGNGKDAELLRLKISKLKSNISYYKGVNQKKVIEFYASANVFILPSTSEPWGLVVNEAMLCKLPILVSNHCGCYPHLVQDNVNGFSFDPNNKIDIQAKIEFMMQNDNLNEMGQKSFELIQNYTPERSAQEMYNLFINHIK